MPLRLLGWSFVIWGLPHHALVFAPGHPSERELSDQDGVAEPDPADLRNLIRSSTRLRCSSCPSAARPSSTLPP